MITVDTHVILWDALRPELLSSKAQKAIKTANESDGILFCEISLWEIAMLIHRKRIHIPISYLEFINLLRSSNKYYLQGITPEIAELSVTLAAEINQDPADRIICATSLIMKNNLLTADKNLQKSKVINTVW